MRQRWKKPTKDDILKSFNSPFDDKVRLWELKYMLYLKNKVWKISYSRFTKNNWKGGI